MMKCFTFDRGRIALPLFFLSLVAIMLPLGMSVGAQEVSRPIVTKNVGFGVSAPLRDLAPITPSGKEVKAEDDIGALGPVGDTNHDFDPVVQTSVGSLGIFQPSIPGPLVTFAGIGNPVGCNGCSPPDPNGDIGPNHYVQMVNTKFQIYSRTGTPLMPNPLAINTLFAGFGGPCQLENAGDPVVLYDQLADRWLLSQFSDGTAPFFNCVAISQTPDPLGAYFLYAFSAPSFPDYPKYGIWSDGYYINTNEGGVTGNYALDRTQMLAGNPSVTSIRLAISQNPFGLLPADIDGTTLPPANSPAYFVGTRDDGVNGGVDSVLLYKFAANFVTPASSTFTGPTILPVAAFDSIFPCSGGSTPSRNCIPQPGQAVTKIDILSYRQRPTFRLAYRNFGTHESLVTSQSVEATTAMAGMRWYELRDPNGTPTIFQQGTYAPGATDGIHRWMGSIAMDKQGNMGLGYSVSSATDVFPGIRYTGRLVGDPLGTMPQGEGVIVDGAGSQTSTGSRWGDYSSMSVDPTDDCTFWYTTQYYAATSAATWSTRVGAFKFPECGAGTPTPTPTATPTSTPTATPTATPTNTPTATPTATPTGTPTATPTATPTGTPTATPTPGFESDIAPRPLGNGTVDATDVTQSRRFATALDVPNPATNEGQRADSAPRATNGDGVLNSGDVVQSRRYATGLDPQTNAGGPNVAAAPAGDSTSVFSRVYNYFFGREIRVVPTGPPNYGKVSFVVKLAPKGDELASSFTLEYDPAKLTAPQIGIGKKRGGIGVTLTTNTDEPGKIAVLYDSVEAFRASSEAKDLIVITFDVVNGADGQTTVGITDSVTSRYLSDAFGNSLSVSYTDGTIDLSAVAAE